MKTPIGLCIVGCGNIAKRHAGNALLLGPERVNLYFASRSETLAREYSDEYKAAGYFGSYEQAAADPRIDAMLFCTPHDRHIDDVRLAAKYGKTAIVEKPMARIASEADEMIEVARQAGIRVLIAENYPYRVPVGAVRRMIHSGALGDLKHIELTYSRYIEQRDWRCDAIRMGGGAMIDGGIHLISALTNIAGEVETVFALTPPQTLTNMEGEDSMSALIKMKSGAVAQLLYSWVVPPNKPVERISAFGTTGSIHADLSTGSITHLSKAGEKTWRADSDLKGSVSMLADFVEALATGNEPALSVAACRRDLAIVLACYDSLKSGNSVSL